MISFPEQIERTETLAKQKGWGVAALCGEIGIHRATWQRWKNGEHQPTVGTWERIQHAVVRLPHKQLKPAVASSKGD